MTLNSKLTHRSPLGRTHNSEPTRAGVFICECGDRVASILDVRWLVEAARELPAVVYAGRAPYWCSTDGRERLQEIASAQGLDRVVVAGCSPRTHKRLFGEAIAGAGLNAHLLGLVNIREGCAWPHRQEPEAATARARDQIAMEAAHVAALTPRPPVEVEIAHKALVIGGGVAGMTAALELVDAGVPVTLVERTATLGGAAISSARELVADLTQAVQTDAGITLQLESQITQVDGSVGAYQITIAQKTRPATRNTQHATRNTFGAIIVASGAPDQETAELARLLRLTQDTEGFFPEWRVRLRPEDYLERGIYVCGSAHYPCDAAEAQFQAYSAASRALRHLRQGKIIAHGPVAQVVPEKCNGCGDCFTVCPFAAVTMTERPMGLSLPHVDPLLCTGCGNCISICPVGAVTVASWSDAQLEAQMRVALNGVSPPGPRAGAACAGPTGAACPDGQSSPPWLAPACPGRQAGPGRGGGTGSRQPHILIFACEWSGYAAAELAGAQKLAYPSNVRMIRLDCSGRLQAGLILKAFEMGAAGVLVLGCKPRLCHYERGNERVAAAYQQVESITGLLGLPPNCLQLAWVPPDDGPAFAELVSRFAEGVAGNRE